MFIGVMFDLADGVGGSVLFIGVAIVLFIIDTESHYAVIIILTFLISRDSAYIDLKRGGSC